MTNTKGTIKVWHVEATRKAAEILGIPAEAVTREMYEAFEADVYPLYQSEDALIREDLSRLIRERQQ